MTLQDFHDRLAQASPDARVVFATDEGRISAGYHVTEFKLAQIQSIDCGATPSQWTEASFQLLDGRGGEHMTAQKFQAILTRSAAILPGLLAAPFRIEFSIGNKGLRIHTVSAVTEEDGALIVDLKDDAAACKPMLRAQSAPAARACC